MSRIILANKLKERFYIVEYYFGQNMFIGTTRLFGAPIMFALGLWFLYSEASQMSLLYSGILILYSVFFGLRPWAMLYFKRSMFETSVFNVEISADGIKFWDEEYQNFYDYTSIVAIEKRKEYFVIKLKNKKEIYLPKAQLDSSEISILMKRSI
ncbi:MAG: YcxB family protein [Bacteroidales bacterium]|nr:YcxB family protein [Bacteroidales bacterium]